LWKTCGKLLLPAENSFAAVFFHLLPQPDLTRLGEKWKRYYQTTENKELGRKRLKIAMWKIISRAGS